MNLKLVPLVANAKHEITRRIVGGSIAQLVRALVRETKVAGSIPALVVFVPPRFTTVYHKDQSALQIEVANLLAVQSAL